MTRPSGSGKPPTGPNPSSFRAATPARLSHQRRKRPAVPRGRADDDEIGNAASGVLQLAKRRLTRLASRLEQPRREALGIRQLVRQVDRVRVEQRVLDGEEDDGITTVRGGIAVKERGHVPARRQPCTQVGPLAGHRPGGVACARRAGAAGTRCVVEEGPPAVECSQVNRADRDAQGRGRDVGYGSRHAHERRHRRDHAGRSHVGTHPSDGSAGDRGRQDDHGGEKGKLEHPSRVLAGREHEEAPDDEDPDRGAGSRRRLPTVTARGLAGWRLDASPVPPLR